MLLIVLLLLGEVRLVGCCGLFAFVFDLNSYVPGLGLVWYLLASLVAWFEDDLVTAGISVWFCCGWACGILLFDWN